MKKTTIALTLLATLNSVQIHAFTIYTDKEGQLFATPAQDRTVVGKYVKKIVPTEKKAITIMNTKSPTFLLGKETHINMKFIPEDAPQMWFKAGVRIQGTFESTSTDDKSTTNNDTTIMDAYLRRVRFELAAGFGKHTSFTMDIRNDKANKGLDNKENGFNVGDAYLKIKKPFNTSLVNFKLYRAKIDVSRTETVKSARVVAYDRPLIADQAAQYISYNRRATNVQMYGNWNKKIHYQIATGAATSPSKVKDANGSKGFTKQLSNQSFFIGGKIKLSPFDGWEELQNTETYMGKGKHFTLGAAYWTIPIMKGTNANAQPYSLAPSLINVEASMHYKGLMIQAEYFKFGDVVKDWATTTAIQTGTSTGWYATTEYVFTDLHYIAPFIRYESWDRFNGQAGYGVTSTLAGINWYLRGNTTKIGFVAQKDTYEVYTGNKDVTKLRFTSQWFF